MAPHVFVRGNLRLHRIVDTQQRVTQLVILLDLLLPDAGDDRIGLLLIDDTRHDRLADEIKTIEHFALEPLVLRKERVVLSLKPLDTGFDTGKGLRHFCPKRNGLFVQFLPYLFQNVRSALSEVVESVFRKLHPCNRAAGIDHKLDNSLLIGHDGGSCKRGKVTGTDGRLGFDGRQEGIVQRLKDLDFPGREAHAGLSKKGLDVGPGDRPRPGEACGRARPQAMIGLPDMRQSLRKRRQG
ncbi:hypothetical protein [Rhizobium sp. CSW-27]|uniref:hypothetical protein n=1 Tax=Rhizobium sp. CSW-27 TaxID=2839985 RepID=UPI0020786970|nr:hypothetical protein [Rhizobium sp. CSW-27]